MRHRNSPRPLRYVSSTGREMRHLRYPPRCEHYECQRRRAAELTAMGRLQDAIRAAHESVPCRRRP